VQHELGCALAVQVHALGAQARAAVRQAQLGRAVVQLPRAVAEQRQVLPARHQVQVGVAVPVEVVHQDAAHLHVGQVQVHGVEQPAAEIDLDRQRTVVTEQQLVGVAVAGEVHQAQYRRGRGFARGGGQKGEREQKAHGRSPGVVPGANADTLRRLPRRRPDGPAGTLMGFNISRESHLGVGAEWPVRPPIPGSQPAG
jgi:hypothetical protein